MSVVIQNKLECSAISICELLYETSLVFLVSLVEENNFSPFKVTIWSTIENSVIYSFPKLNSKIISVKVNKKRMLVVQKNLLNIYNLLDMKLIHTIEVGFINPSNIALSYSVENENILCYSYYSEEGLIIVYDLFTLYTKHFIKAHKSKLGRLSLSYKGDLIASCSEKGTIIRVFSTTTGEKLFTYKRGICSSLIYSISFNRAGNKILVGSESGTIHLFFLMKYETTKNSFISSILSSIGEKLLPKEYEDSLGVPRSDISYNNLKIKCENIVSFNSEREDQALCFTKNGWFLLLSINEEKNLFSLITEYNVCNLKLIN